MTCVVPVRIARPAGPFPRGSSAHDNLRLSTIAAPGPAEHRSSPSAPRFVSERDKRRRVTHRKTAANRLHQFGLVIRHERGERGLVNRRERPSATCTSRSTSRRFEMLRNVPSSISPPPLGRYRRLEVLPGRGCRRPAGFPSRPERRRGCGVVQTTPRPLRARARDTGRESTDRSTRRGYARTAPRPERWHRRSEPPRRRPTAARRSYAPKKPGNG